MKGRTVARLDEPCEVGADDERELRFDVEQLASGDPVAVWFAVRASLDPRCVLDVGARRLLDRVHATRAHPARRGARRRPQARPALADRGLGTRGARVISRGWRRYGSCDGRGRAHPPARRVARGRGRRARLLRLLVVGGADGKRRQRRSRQRRRRRLVAGGGSRRRARRRRRRRRRTWPAAPGGGDAGSGLAPGTLAVSLDARPGQLQRSRPIPSSRSTPTTRPRTSSAQDKCRTFEAPFVYLSSARSRRMLLDTGATTSAALRDKVASLIGGKPLLVAHSHAHGDHVASDGSFSGQTGMTVVAEDGGRASRARSASPPGRRARARSTSATACSTWSPSPATRRRTSPSTIARRACSSPATRSTRASCSSATGPPTARVWRGCNSSRPRAPSATSSVRTSR